MVIQRGGGGENVCWREEYLGLEDGVSRFNNGRQGPPDPLGIVADPYLSRSGASGDPQPPYCLEGKNRKLYIQKKVSFRV